ncbi:hypothetical protein L596_029878 [Steinernema carpocapsae]|uniref:Uncharacterized protein n=1 Tax=Steinernema carpocapsae TaxID=34508 RepID=A0A4U5LR32_STECR|nr:hypothetical protein L596_029878 [Steinernema carpocapsae]
MALVSKLSLSAHPEVPEPTEAQGKQQSDWILQELLSGETRRTKAYKLVERIVFTDGKMFEMAQFLLFQQLYGNKIRPVIAAQSLQITDFRQLIWRACLSGVASDKRFFFGLSCVPFVRRVA